MRVFNNKYLITLSFMTLFLPLTSQITHAQSIDYGSFETLFGEPVTTSATGSPQRLSEVAMNMEIISADEISRSGAKSIPDVLKRYSGIAVKQFTETQQEVGIRGTASSYNDTVLVLVNGRQVYLDYYGFVAWETIPVQLAEIRQIEVVKGPNTALFGVNAVMGVINIVTYNPQYDDINVATVSVGTQGYRHAGLVDTMKLSDTAAIRYSVAGDRIGTFDDDPIAGGINFTNPVAQHRTSSRAFGSLQGVFKVYDGVELELEYTGSEADRNEIISNQYGHLDYSTRSYRATMRAESKMGLWDASLYYNTVEQPVEMFVSNDVLVGSLSNVFKIGVDHTFRVMGEYRDNRMRGFHNGTLQNRVKYNAYAASGMWDWQLANKWSMNSAYRFDMMDFDYKGDIDALAGVPFTEADYDRRKVRESSYNWGLVYQRDDKNTWRMSYGHGVDVPSFLEFSTQSFVYGNPYVPVSTIDSYEIGHDHKFTPETGDVTLRTAVFYNQRKDLQILELAFPSTFVNGGDSTTTGVELSLSGKYKENLRWDTRYSLARVDDDLTVLAGNPIEPASVEHVANIHLGYDKNDWSFDGFATYFSNFTEPQLQGLGIVPYDVDAQVMLDARVGYAWSDGVDISLMAKNLQGKNFQGSVQELSPQVFLSTTLDLSKVLHKQHGERYHPY